MSVSTTCLVVLLAFGVFPTQAGSQQSNADNMAPGHSIFVLPVEQHPETRMDMVERLEEWGRWVLVEDERHAELILKLEASGSGAWGRAQVVATIVDPATGRALWRSKKQSGTRSLFRGYASPFIRANEGILKQMKEASKKWPSK